MILLKWHATIAKLFRPSDMFCPGFYRNEIGLIFDRNSYTWEKMIVVVVVELQHYKNISICIEYITYIIGRKYTYWT